MRTSIAALVVSVVLSPAIHGGGSYDVAEIYKGVDVPVGTVGLTTFGNVEALELVLVPTRLDPGSYTVSVTRRGQDLYEVLGYQIFVKTRYCYEYAYAGSATLVVDSAAGFSKGKLIFE